MEEYQIGDAVVFVDKDGNSHNALVIHVYPSCLNICYVDPRAELDNFGAARILETSVPFKQEGMSGFYIKQ